MSTSQAPSLVRPTPSGHPGKPAVPNTVAHCVIRVLGAFSFTAPAAEVESEVWRRSHARRLVQMLASAPRMVEPRAKVLETLWPDSDKVRSRNRLHHTVHLIRQSMERLPASYRLQIIVGVDRVELHLPPDVVVDAQEFLRAADEDSPDDASRLAAVERAIGWYRDDLAIDWQGVDDIETRRVWMSSLLDRLLSEAIQLAIDLDRPESALQYALRRTQRPDADVEAHCAYASLLADQGRAGAALLHCRNVRGLLQEEDTSAAGRLDALTRDIQQHANRMPAKVAVASAPALSGDHGGLPHRKALIGYERLLEASLRALADPYAAIVTLTGPPGCGKSALAAELADRSQVNFRHGVLWVDCAQVLGRGQALVDTLADAMARSRPDQGPLPKTADAVSHRLGGRQMLIVLDGLDSSPDILAVLSGWLACNKDVRWLATGWSSLRMRGEKSVFVDASELLRRPEQGAALHAAHVIGDAGNHSWSLQDRGIRTTVEAIAAVTDGLPALLESAGDLLQTVWPNELLSRLDRDPLILVRHAAQEANLVRHGASSFTLVAWVRRAPPGLKSLLSIAGKCRSWLTRDDLAALWGDTEGDVAAAVDHAVRHHYMLRRVRKSHESAWSEFRVLRPVAHALSMSGEGVSPGVATPRIAAWLSRPSTRRPSSATVAQPGDWFDDRVDDIDALIREWQLLGNRAAIAALCAVHAPNWSTSAHLPRILEWMASLGEYMDQVPNELAPRLFVERARLRAGLGEMHGAFEDAGRAMARLGDREEPALRQEALKLIERFGVTQTGPSRLASVSQKGIEAGESLLHVATMTLRQGDFTKGLQLCGEAICVFNYFGLTRGLLKANQIRAKIAFGIGDMALAQQCIVNAERAAQTMGDRLEMDKVESQRVMLLMADMQFQRAIKATSGLMSKSETASTPVLLVRSLSMLGWANYAIGAYPVARAFTNELRDHARLTANMGMQITAETLATLIDLRTGSEASAMRRVRQVLDMMSSERVSFDPQADYVNVLDLMVQLRRFDLAAMAVDLIDAFKSRPGHRLRLWVEQRSQALRALIPPVEEIARPGAIATPARTVATVSVADLLVLLLQD